MKLSEIQELMRSFDASGITVLEVSGDGTTLRMQKGCAVPAPLLMPGSAPAVPKAAPAASDAPVPAAPKAEPAPGVVAVKAPIVGVVYAAQSPSDAPFVQVGQEVKKGQPLCLIEAMKMMNEVTAPADGVVKAILFQNGELAEFGAELVTIQKD